LKENDFLLFEEKSSFLEDLKKRRRRGEFSFFH
jgi:hypothetical protein